MQEQTITISLVERALSAPPVGFAAQKRMITRPRGEPGNSPRRAGAVLIALYPFEGELVFPLTLRTDKVADHRGQISLPGGQREDRDGSYQETALRETREELGVEPAGVRLLGPLTHLYIPPSSFDVYPFVGYLAQPPSFVPDPHEVAEVIVVPVSVLLDPASKSELVEHRDGKDTAVPYYAFQGYVIWGATAMILSELEVMIRDAICTPPGEPNHRGRTR